MMGALFSASLASTTIPSIELKSSASRVSKRITFSESRNFLPRQSVPLDVRIESVYQDFPDSSFRSRSVHEASLIQLTAAETIVPVASFKAIASENDWR